MKKFLGYSEFTSYLPGAKDKAPASGYGAPAPGNPAPASSHGAPASAYGTPSSGYGAAPPQAYAPQTSAPVSGYGAPPQRLPLQQQAPQPASHTQSPAPVSGYGAPPPQGHIPQQHTPQTATAQPQASSSRPHVPVVACITLNSNNIIRFMNFPPADIEAFQDVITASWTKGIYRVEPYGEAQQIQMNGSPWKDSYRGVDATRLLIRNLLASLYERGWVLEGGIDYSKKDLSRDTLMFRHRPTPPPADFLVISFDRCDRLKIMPPPPADLSAAILTHLGPEVKTHKVNEGGALDFDMRGDPWHAEGKETVKAALLVVGLVTMLEGQGWGLYGSVNVGGDSTGVDADVFIMRKARGWVPGMRVGRSGFIFE